MTKKVKQKLDVFLCHASGDKRRVKSLYTKLSQEKNIDPWLDKEKLLPGQNWDLEIRKAVSKTDVILVCLSKQSVNKEGYVQKEIRLALDAADEKLEGEIFLIPLKLEECDVPSRLSAWHWLDYFEDGAYEKLLLSLQKRADYFGIKIGQDVLKNKSATSVSKTSSKKNKSNTSIAGKIDNDRFLESRRSYFILQNSMLKEKAAKRKIENISKSPPSIQVDLFCETLRELEEYLDTGDLRKLNIKSLMVIRDDILEIIKNLRDLPSPEIFHFMSSRDGLLESLRDARDGLQISLGMFDMLGGLDETKSKKLFAELRLVRKNIASAIKFFR